MKRLALIPLLLVLACSQAFPQTHAGGGAISFTSLTAGTNTAALVIGTGGSLATSGSGSIAATTAPFSGMTGSLNPTTQLGTGTGAITLAAGGTNQSITLTPSGAGVVSIPTLNLTNPLGVAYGGWGTSSGTFTSPGAVALNAGGTNQNITLTPSGTGYTVLNGKVGVNGVTIPGAALDVLAPNDGIRVLSNSSIAYPKVALGRTAIEATIAVAANTGNFLFGTSAGDLAIRSESQKVFLGTGSGNAAIGISGSTVALYNGVGTVGNGIPAFTGQSSQTNFSAAIGSTNILTTSVAATQLYRVGYAMWQTASGSGGVCGTNATATVTLAWTDPASQAQTKAEAAMNLPPTLAAGAYQQDVINVPAKASTALTYSIAWANGNCTTQPTASILLYAEALN